MLHVFLQTYWISSEAIVFLGSRDGLSGTLGFSCSVAPSSLLEEVITFVLEDREEENKGTAGASGAVKSECKMSCGTGRVDLAIQFEQNNCPQTRHLLDGISDSIMVNALLQSGQIKADEVNCEKVGSEEEVTDGSDGNFAEFVSRSPNTLYSLVLLWERWHPRDLLLLAYIYSQN